MNIIKIDSARRINGTNNKINVTAHKEHDSSDNILIVVLSDDDINNDNCLIKLRGHIISGLVIPKKYKFTFNSLSIATLITPHLKPNTVISYY